MWVRGDGAGVAVAELSALGWALVALLLFVGLGRCAALFLRRREIGFLCRAIALLRDCATRLANEQGARRGGNVRLPHQTFADEKG